MIRWPLTVGAVLLLGCTGSEVKRPSLDGPYACGPHTCASGQICFTESSGSQCQVNPDAGIGQYQTYSWMCIALPAACDGIPSCSCVVGSASICSVSDDGRQIDYGCI
jgi:hypothetical protein